MSAEQMRAEFAHHFGVSFDELDALTQEAWEAAWKATHSALAIKLPAKSRTAHEAITACLALLKAAGVKVKP